MNPTPTPVKSTSTLDAICADFTLFSYVVFYSAMMGVASSQHEYWVSVVCFLMCAILVNEAIHDAKIARLEAQHNKMFNDLMVEANRGVAGWAETLASNIELIETVKRLEAELQAYKKSFALDTTEKPVILNP